MLLTVHKPAQGKKSLDESGGIRCCRYVRFFATYLRKARLDDFLFFMREKGRISYALYTCLMANALLINVNSNIVRGQTMMMLFCYRYVPVPARCLTFRLLVFR